MTINIVRVYKYCHGEGWKNCDRRMSGKGHCVLARYEAHQPSTLHMWERQLRVWLWWSSLRRRCIARSDGVESVNKHNVVKTTHFLCFPGKNLLISTKCWGAVAAGSRSQLLRYSLRRSGMASIEVDDDLTVTEDNGRTSKCTLLCSVGTRMDIRSAGSLGCNYCPEKKVTQYVWTKVLPWLRLFVLCGVMMCGVWGFFVQRRSNDNSIISKLVPL